MNTYLYFLIKFFPFWGPFFALSLIPMGIKLFKRGNFWAGVGTFCLVLAFAFLTYLYFAKDGYQNAVPFLRQWLV